MIFNFGFWIEEEMLTQRTQRDFRCGNVRRWESGKVGRLLTLLRSVSVNLAEFRRAPSAGPDAGRGRRGEEQL